MCSCSCSAEPAGGTSEWHESRCNTTAQHAVQDPTGVGEAADVWAEHPEPPHQPRQWTSTAAGEMERGCQGDRVVLESFKKKNGFKVIWAQVKAQKWATWLSKFKKKEKLCPKTFEVLRCRNYTATLFLWNLKLRLAIPHGRFPSGVIWGKKNLP